jgi:hypothetical protein
MNRESIEERLHRYFGSARTALAAALSEVKECFAYPEYLSAILHELGPDVPADDAVVQWAITRGRQWFF